MMDASLRDAKNSLAGHIFYQAEHPFRMQKIFASGHSFFYQAVHPFGMQKIFASGHSFFYQAAHPFGMQKNFASVYP